MGRRAMPAVLAMALTAAAAAGGTVYLRDGRNLVGEITRKDGKIIVEMELGTVEVDESEALLVSDGGPSPTARTRPSAAPPAPAAPAERHAAIAVRLRPYAEWDIQRATLPEPVYFMTARKLELLAGMAETETLRHELGQWRIFVHDRRRKVGTQWLTRAQQRKGRDRFLEAVKEGGDAARKARYVYGDSPAAKAKKARLRAEAEKVLTRGAAAWPDDLVRDFLTAALEFEAGRYPQAERRFRTCAERAPLIAAFHQGRGLALAKMKRPLMALEAMTAVLRLRDDRWEALSLVKTAMKETPGAYLKDPVYVKAKALVERYAEPKYRRRGYGRGVSWLMPGKPWQSRYQGFLVPPYDRHVARQALAVPVSEGGALLVDKAAVAEAEAIYVELGGDRIVRAGARRSGYSHGKEDLPLTIISAPGATFTPVDLTSPAALTDGRTVTVHAANLYRQMGTRLRATETKMATVDGKLAPASGLLPGEPLGAVFAGGRFAAFLTGRCDLEAPDCGKSGMLSPTDLAEWAKRMKRSFRYRSGYSSGPTLKADAPRPAAEGQVFLVHILAGEKPPESLGK